MSPPPSRTSSPGLALDPDLAPPSPAFLTHARTPSPPLPHVRARRPSLTSRALEMTSESDLELVTAPASPLASTATITHDASLSPHATANPFASPPSTPSASIKSIPPAPTPTHAAHPSTSTATRSSTRPNTASSTHPPASRPPFAGSRTSSFRETFSAPPVFPRASLSFAYGPSTSASGTSTPSASVSGYPSTAASSSLALAGHPHIQTVPGLAGPVPVQLAAYEYPAETGDAAKDGDVLMKSCMLRGEVDKPWLGVREARVRASYWITIATAFVGVLASAVVCYLGWIHTPLITQPLCLVMQDDFNTFSVDADGATWSREVDMGGFGNGQFEMTTTSSDNTFVKDGMLYIVPTLTALSIPGGNDSVFNGYTYNISGCTSATNFKGTACGAISNATSGTIINPVMSARLTTQKSHSIQYGKVEIRAKNPTGDWLWPALWMLPVNETYGPWPLSGEIDIMESRGNDASYPDQGNNVVRGSLNWGPTLALNAVFKTYGWWLSRRSAYSAGFHTYTLEWTQDFMRVYVDTRLHRMIDLRFNVPFFERGDFPPTVQNNSQTIALQNPWLNRGNSAPFDQPFFLIMNVAVGGTNGWFPDNAGGKPWVDGSAQAMRDFALAQDKWYPTWPESPEDRAMVIDYVKMWQLC